MAIIETPYLRGFIGQQAVSSFQASVISRTCNICLSFLYCKLILRQNMSIQVFFTTAASAIRLLKHLVVGALLALMGAWAMASQVVGEVTLTIGKANIERAAGAAAPEIERTSPESKLKRTTEAAGSAGLYLNS